MAVDLPMMPIQALLNRIRWDPELAKAVFEIGILDHVQQGIIRIPFRSIRFEAGNHFAFQLVNDAGEVLTIPFHRIRAVYQDGLLIWRRPG
jgi:uncharacterized protein (UPF0248 family)